MDGWMDTCMDGWMCVKAEDDPVNHSVISLF